MAPSTAIMWMLTVFIVVSVASKKTKLWELVIIGSWAGLLCLQTSVGPSLQQAMGSIGNFLASIG